MFALFGSPEFSVDTLLQSSHPLFEQLKIMAGGVFGAIKCARAYALFQNFNALL